MGRNNLLYFSLALIIRERLYFWFNVLAGASVIFYVSLNTEIVHLVESIKLASNQIQIISQFNSIIAMSIFGFLSGNRIIHAIAETGIMLAVGTNRTGVMLLVICKEFLYLLFSYLTFLLFLAILTIFSNLSFLQIGLVSLNAFGFGIVGSIALSIPLSIYVTSIDPYDSIRRQK